MKYDLIIIGAGPAGMTAGLYAVRENLKTVIVSKDIGGTANSILLLENWPGFKGTGAELMKQFYEHLKTYNVNFVMDEVSNIFKNNREFIVKTKKAELRTRAVILATGTERKKLNIPGEKELTGKGVSYCTTCDAFFFRNKILAVIGGSDCAAVSALTLADIAKKVYIIYRGKKLRCENINSKKLENRKNIQIIYNAIPKRIKGKEKVESLIVRQQGKNKEISLDGVFIEIGAVPLTKFAKNLNLKFDKENYVVVDKNMKTSIPGIFAAGDITSHKLKQVIVAAGQGAIATKSANEYINKKQSQVPQ